MFIDDCSPSSQRRTSARAIMAPVFLLGLGVLLFNAEDEGGGGGGGAASPPADQPRLFTQEEVNRIAAERGTSERRALLNKLGVADLDQASQAIKQAKTLAEEAEQRRLQELENQGKLKELLDETRAAKDAVIAQKDQELERVRQEARQKQTQIDLERLCAKAVKPSQAAYLLQATGALQYDQEGKLYVAHPDGKPKLDAKGNPLAVDAFVSQWFAENTHLLGASGVLSLPQGQAGARAGSPSMVPGAVEDFDESKRASVAYIRRNMPSAKRWAAQRAQQNKG